jgi:RNA polymerase subunit RPABC4/transcription elongation factor Spt4
MTYCYNCGRITPGDPLFCHTCGRSYDTKLCPRLHPNPRSAEVCSRCGSRDLSVPQPKVAFGTRVLEWIVRMVLGIVFVMLTFTIVFEFVIEILRTPSGQAGVVVLGGLIALLGWLWTKLPEWLRKFVRKHFTKRKGTRDEA